VLILLPAPQTKAKALDGAPFDPDELSFPELADTRARIGAALAGSGGDRASDPAAPAHELYRGSMFVGLDYESFDAAARRRAQRWVVLVSARWGALRLNDEVPPYRLNMCFRLPGLGHAPQAWQPSLAKVLPAAAGRGLVVDGRVAGYAVAWRPKGALADRTVAMKPVRDLKSGKGPASQNATHIRGVVAHRIVQDNIDPSRPEELAEALSAHFEVQLRKGVGPGKTHELRIVTPDA